MIQQHNPDVLVCLANLSSDEVFTPPALAEKMLDLLPKEIWKDKNATFLDPACKSGVFLREIAKRLVVGLEKEIPDLQKRVNHILTKQLYGIAITELTALLARRSLYCSKYANGKYSVCPEFKTPEGNIIYPNIEHTWEKEVCIYCGASQAVYDREDFRETHAYHFIHTKSPEEIFNMKFDVIIGNPPYQLSDSGFGKSAKPIYHHFVEQAKKLHPRYLVMIIPSRWFIGGKGLEKFRKSMLSDRRIKQLVDHKNFNEVFPGVDIAGGVCYFLWDGNYNGMTKVISHQDGVFSETERYLDEFETFIRDSNALPIIQKIKKLKINNGKTLSNLVSSRKPFGLPTNYKPKKSGVPCWFVQRIGQQYASPKDIKDDNKLLNKWKLLIPKAPIAGQTDFSKPIQFYYDGNIRIAKPGQCCTESWLVACAFESRKEVESFKSYLLTKIVRFLLLQSVISQDITRQNFYLVPDIGDYTFTYTDEYLIQKWGLSVLEWEYINSKIRTDTERDE